MSKILKLTAAAMVFAGAAYAGNVVFEAPVESDVQVAPAEPMGSSNAAWIVPLIALAAIALVVSNNNDNGGSAS